MHPAARVGRVERPGLAGRSARAAPQAVDLDGLADEALDHPGQGDGIGSVAGHGGDDTGAHRNGARMRLPSGRRCAYLHHFSTGSCRLLHRAVFIL